MSLKIDIFGKLFFDLTCFFPFNFHVSLIYDLKKKIIFLITMFFKITYLMI